MDTNLQKPVPHPITVYLVPAIFFTCFYLHVLFVIDPRIIYTFNGMGNGIGTYSYLFELRLSFFLTTVKEPGGMVLYIIGALTHACHEAWLGAFLITLVGILFFAATTVYTRACSLSVYFPIAYIPALLMLFFYSTYEHRYLFTMVVVLGVLCLAIVYQTFGRYRSAVRFAALSLLFPVAYWLFNCGSLLFAFLIVIYEYHTTRKQWGYFLSAVLIEAALLVAAVTVFFNVYAVFDFNAVKKSEMPILLFYLYFPLVIVLLSGEKAIRLKIVNKIRPDRPALAPVQKKSPKTQGKTAGGGQSTRGKQPAPAKPLRRFARTAGLGLVAISLLTGAIWVAGKGLDKDRKSFGLRLYYLRNGQWPQIIGMGTEGIVGRFYMLNMHIIDLALSETGALASAMFKFPQAADPEPLLLMNSSFEKCEFKSLVWATAFETFLRLGEMNYAEKLCAEAMGITTAHPFLLRPRGFVCCVKGQKETARVYLNKLAAAPFFRKNANALLEFLEHDTTATTTSANNQSGASREIHRLRTCRDTIDHIMFVTGEEEILLNLLKSNNYNKMAFEYLMAYYLQTRQLAKFMQNLGRLDDFGYTSIPVPFEEALIIYARIMGQRADMLVRLPIRPETYERMAAFDEMYERNKSGGNPSRALYPVFGSSYFFFFGFGFSGTAP